jgi:hypothetical protein
LFYPMVCPVSALTASANLAAVMDGRRCADGSQW